jgi:isoquinoline 1-oxidoreductase beta subunit
MPVIDVHIVPSQRCAYRHGRTGPAAAGAGLCQRAVQLTGKRLRKLPFDLASA